MGVRSHFDVKASAYDKEREQGPLRIFVIPERNCMNRLLQFKKGSSVLDVGCGQGAYSSMIKKKGGIPFGIDISKSMITAYKKNGFKGTVSAIESFKHSPFDVVFCGGSLEFTKDPQLALDAMARNTKKGGLFVMIYPRFNLTSILYKCYHLSHGVHIHLFSDAKIRRMLKKSGFTVLKHEKPNWLSGAIQARKN